MRTYFNFAGFSVGLILLLLVTFGLLQWLHIPSGNFLDWVIGGATFWWLMLIVTVPWNIHFEAKEVFAESEESIKKGIRVESKQVEYVTKLAHRSLVAAIGLHLLSAIGLYGLALSGISVVGYVGSGAALLLTILRPAIRFYQYLATRLAMVRHQFSYPREDVVELRSRFEIVEAKVTEIEHQLDLNYPNSWAMQEERQKQAMRQELTHLSATLQTLAATNQSEHHRLSREAENAIAQLSTDGQVLNHVREIIRFFKEA